jgi:hypothetical protein
MRMQLLCSARIELSRGEPQVCQRRWRPVAVEKRCRSFGDPGTDTEFDCVERKNNSVFQIMPPEFAAGAEHPARFRILLSL